jgi:uncharacterized membrane protein YphA (DoxX/SURF4 family)
VSPRSSMTGAAPSDAWDPARIFRPQPIARIEVLRILLPLAILGFLSGRIAHADDWLSDAGFQVPYMAGDWRQPLPLHGIPVWAAWSVCGILIVSGLMTSAGAFTRWASGVFAACLAYVALSDRFAAFTVSKLSPILMFAICVSPAGARWSVDAWRRRRRTPGAALPTRVSGGCIAFFQILLPVFYFSSGMWKARGEWLAHYDPLVLWTQLHDSYQTPVSWFLANHVPAFGWTWLQWITLVFECGAPLWFAWSRSRPYALAWAIAMHAMIGLMFGPVIWFGLLMIVLLVGSYAPIAWLERSLDVTIGRWLDRR